MCPKTRHPYKSLINQKVVDQFLKSWHFWKIQIKTHRIKKNYTPTPPWGEVGGGSNIRCSSVTFSLCQCMSSSSGCRSCDVTAGGYWGQLLVYLCMWPWHHPVRAQQVNLQQKVARLCEEKATAPVVIPTGEPLAKVTTVVPGAKVTTMEVCEAVTLAYSHYQSI